MFHHKQHLKPIQNENKNYYIWSISRMLSIWHSIDILMFADDQRCLLRIFFLLSSNWKSTIGICLIFWLFYSVIWWANLLPFFPLLKPKEKEKKKQNCNQWRLIILNLATLFRHSMFERLIPERMLKNVQSLSKTKISPNGKNKNHVK